MESKKEKTRLFQISLPNGETLWEEGRMENDGEWLLVEPYKEWDYFFVGEGWYWFEIVKDYPWMYVREVGEDLIFIADCSETDVIWYGIDGTEYSKVNGKEEANRKMKLVSFE